MNIISQNMDPNAGANVLWAAVEQEREGVKHVGFRVTVWIPSGEMEIVHVIFASEHSIEDFYMDEAPVIAQAREALVPLLGELAKHLTITTESPGMEDW